MERISHVYQDRIREIMGHAKLGQTVTESSVYQAANNKILPYIDGMIDEHILPGSGVEGTAHLADLLAKAQAGASCLLLLEHYSNFDLPVFNYLLRKEGSVGHDIADAVVAIAGMKLSEDNPVVSAFAEAYARIVIIPSRSLVGLDPERDKPEFVRSNAINRAAMKALNQVKVSGKLILVFPAGTRFRPWDPHTKRGVREIDSYIKSFDYLCLVAINGDILRIQQGKMAEDLIAHDLVRVTAGPVVRCADFREAARAAADQAGIEDKKQAVADAIMAELDRMHAVAEAVRPRPPEAE